jgi:transposase
MAKPYSQDLRDRVIDAVERGKLSRRAATRHYEVSESVAVKWLERLERHGSREPVGHRGHRASKLMPHRDFLMAARAEKSGITLQGLCDRLSAERGVKTDTSMMSRFFRKIGVTFKNVWPAPSARWFCRDWRLISLLQRIRPRGTASGQDGDTRAPVLIKLPASDRAVF